MNLELSYLRKQLSVCMSLLFLPVRPTITFSTHPPEEALFVHPSILHISTQPKKLSMRSVLIRLNCKKKLVTGCSKKRMLSGKRLL